MKKSITSLVFSGSIWGIFSKIIDAVTKFISIPLLVAFYGKTDYGLIALAFSLNAYLRLMDMGMNIGSIRFFSMWIAQKNWEKISKVSRSSIVFYGVIGVLNAIIFVLMGRYSSGYFKLTAAQAPVFEWIMYTLAASTILNWMSNVINQLLTANNELSWINRVTVISSGLNFLTAVIAIKLKLAISTYFLLYTISTLVIIPLNIFRLKVYKMPRTQLLSPKWNQVAFKEILGYSMAIFAMGIFQFSADNLRPLLLGKYSSKGIAVLTEYRVIQTVAMLIIAFGGVFLDVLLPSAAKAYAENDATKISKMVYKGTSYISAFLSLVVFCLITNSKVLLTLYMGVGYNTLSPWLVIWLLTVLVSMQNAPVASLVLSSGKTKVLVISSAISCAASLPITALLAPRLNVGAAIIGYSVYVFFQMLAYYLYYTPKVLKLNGLRILTHCFFPSASTGVLACLFTSQIKTLAGIKDDFVGLLFGTGVYTIFFGAGLLLFIIRPKEFRALRIKLIGG